MRLAALALLLSVAPLLAANRYVDMEVSTSGDGSSWGSAWKDSTNINWTVVQPGDTIYFSGGESGLHYTSLTLGKSGTEASPITIRVSQEDGKNGPVDWKTYTISGRQWVTLNGARDDDFQIPTNVVHMRDITNNIAIRIFDGSGVQSGSGLVFNGIKILWCEISYVGDPTLNNASGVTINQPSLMDNSEIGYCWIHHNSIDGINNNGGTSGGWDSLTVHHSVIEFNVDDGIQLGLDGLTAHHNIIGQKWRGFTAGHPDMLQQTFVSKGRFHAYNNILFNTWNAWVYNTLGAINGGTVGEVYFYGNLCYMERDSIYETVMNYGVHFGVWGNTTPILSTTQTNVHFFNNTIYNCPDEGLLAAFNSDDKDTHELWRLIVTNTSVINNLLVDASYRYGGSGLRVNGPGNNLSSTNGTFYTTNEVIMKNNVVAGPNKRIGYGLNGTSTHATAAAFMAAGGFTNFNTMPTFQGTGTNSYDFRLAESDTAAKDKGIDLSAFIASHSMAGLATDLYGNPRGFNGTWDIGANEFVGEDTETPEPPPSPPLLLHLSFESEDTADGVIADVSPGATNNALRFGYCGETTNFPTLVTVTNGESVSTGVQFRYYYDDYGEYGRTGDYMGVTNLNAGSVSEFTVALWAKYDAAYDSNGDPDTYLTDHNATLIDSGRYSVTGGWRLGRENFWDGAQSINRTKWEVFTNATLDRLQMSFGDEGDENGATDAMHHYAVVFNQGTNWIYFDGLLKSSNVISQTTLRLNTQSHWLGIGGWPHHGTVVRDPWLTNSVCPSNDDFPNTFWFTGKMDEIRIYDAALTAEEIAALADLPVVPSAPVFTVHPASATRDPNQTVVFTGSATGYPTPTYQWRKDGENISGATGTSYTIINVAEGDEGEYDLVATNSEGITTSNAATLTVNDVDPEEPEPIPPAYVYLENAVIRGGSF